MNGFEQGLARQAWAVYSRFGALLLGCLLVAGCSSEMPSVSGVVTFDDKPLPEGLLQLLPIGETPGRGAGAEIKEGSYTVPAEKKLAPGEYRISITASQETGRKYRNPEPMPGEPRELPEIVQYIPASFNSRSKLQVKIIRGENKHDFQLSGK